MYICVFYLCVCGVCTFVFPICVCVVYVPMFFSICVCVMYVHLFHVCVCVCVCGVCTFVFSICVCLVYVPLCFYVCVFGVCTFVFSICVCAWCMYHCVFYLCVVDGRLFSVICLIVECWLFYRYQFVVSSAGLHGNTWLLSAGGFSVCLLSRCCCRCYRCCLSLFQTLFM